MVSENIVPKFLHLVECWHKYFYLLGVYKLIAFQRNLISGTCVLISQCILMTQIALALCYISFQPVLCPALGQIYLWFFSDAVSSFDFIAWSVIIIANNVDGIVCDILCEVPFGQLSTQIEQNHEGSETAHPVSVLRFEPGTSQNMSQECSNHNVLSLK
jgi:hypothetical protein